MARNVFCLTKLITHCGIPFTIVALILNMMASSLIRNDIASGSDTVISLENEQKIAVYGYSVFA